MGGAGAGAGRRRRAAAAPPRRRAPVPGQGRAHRGRARSGERARSELAEGDLALLVAAPRGRASRCAGRPAGAARQEVWSLDPEGHRLSVGDRLSAVRVERGGGPVRRRAPSVHPVRTPRTWRCSTAIRERRARCAYDIVLNGVELARRLDPNPRSRAAGAGVPHPGDLCGGRRASGSASCSTPSATARRRTAASPSASTGW